MPERADPERNDPPSAWRIDREKWAVSSFEGAGAALEGGRWNLAGMKVVYLSENLAMAAMEKLVHLPKPIFPGCGLGSPRPLPLIRVCFVEQCREH